MRILYLPLGRSTFCMDEAATKIASVRQGLDKVGLEVESPESLLVELDMLEAYVDQCLENPVPVDVVIVQPVTFTDARFIRIAVEKIKSPVLIWSVREPKADGGRLCLNSLTGANLYAHELRGRRLFAMVHGDAEETGVIGEVKRLCLDLIVKGTLVNQNVLVIGDAPDGFFFSNAEESLLSSLGIKIVRRSLNELFTKAKEIGVSGLNHELASIARAISGALADDERVLKSAQVLQVIRNWVDDGKFTAVATRCWPDFFTEMHTAPCGVVSMLNETGIPAACEGDILGAVSMSLLHKLSGQPSFLGDLVHLEEKENSVTFWHCGAGAPSLAGFGGAKAGVHPNRKMGLSVEMAGKEGEVSVIRLGVKGGKARLLLMEGKATGAPQKFLGTCIDVIPDGIPAREWMAEVMKAGFEPHYAVGYGHWTAALADWAASNAIEIVRF